MKKILSIQVCTGLVIGVLLCSLYAAEAIASESMLRTTVKSTKPDTVIIPPTQRPHPDGDQHFMKIGGLLTPGITRHQPAHTDAHVADLLFFNNENTDISAQEGVTLLMEAVQEGNLLKVKQYIASGHDIHTATKSGITALMLAAKMGRLEIVKMLVDAGAEINRRSFGPWPKPPLVRGYGTTSQSQEVAFLPFRTDVRLYDHDHNGFSPLSLAVLHGHVDVVDYLVSKGADVNQKNYGASPLIIAIYFRHPDIAGFLIDKGADLDPATQVLGVKLDPLELSLEFGFIYLSDILMEFKPGDLDTPDGKRHGIPVLHLQAHHGNVKAIRLLVKKGADINQVDSFGFTPILCAVWNNQKQAAETLLTLGADIDCVFIPPKKFSGYKPYAGETPLCLAVHKGFFDIAMLLAQLGANPNIPNEQGITPLMLAVSGTNETLLERLLDKGALVEAKDHSGRTPMIYAAYAGRIEMIELLVHRKGNIRAEDLNGEGVLFYCLWRYADTKERSSLDILKKLIRLGAKVNIQNVDGDSVLMFAARYNSPEATHLLVNHGANVNLANTKGETPVFTAVTRKSPEILDTLLGNGAHVNWKNKKGKTPLNYSFESRKLDSAFILISHGADMNTKDERGVPLLMQMINKNNFAAVDILIESGADVNCSDNAGRNALMLTIQNRNLTLTKKLLDKGANVNAKDNLGITPLMLATGKEDLTLIRTLLDKGANVNAKNELGYTAYMISVFTEQFETADYLESRGADRRSWQAHVSRVEKMKDEGLLPPDAVAEKILPEMIQHLKMQN